MFSLGFFFFVVCCSTEKDQKKIAFDAIEFTSIAVIERGNEIEIEQEIVSPQTHNHSTVNIFPNNTNYKWTMVFASIRFGVYLFSRQG